MYVFLKEMGSNASIDLRSSSISLNSDHYFSLGTHINDTQNILLKISLYMGVNKRETPDMIVVVGMKSRLISEGYKSKQIKLIVTKTAKLKCLSKCGSYSQNMLYRFCLSPFTYWKHKISCCVH